MSNQADAVTAAMADLQEQGSPYGVESPQEGAGRRALRVGLIGSGFMGGAHAHAAAGLGAVIAGVASSSTRSAMTLANRYGATAYGSVEELLAAPLDVVHVTSPNHLHYEHALAVIKAGKHLVCEKPLVATSEQARELVARASEAGIIAATSFNLRFYPLVHHMREQVAGGLEPRLVRGSYLQDWLARDTDWNWRVDAAAGGPLRAVADIGSHLIDALAFILGDEPERVFAHLVTTIPQRTTASGERVTVDTEDAATLIVRWAKGTESVLSVSQVSPGRRNELRIEIDGAAHALAWNSQNPDELWMGNIGQPNVVIHRSPELVPTLAAPSLPAGHVEGYGETFTHMLYQVYRDIRSGSRHTSSTYASLQDGARMAAVSEAILRSHETGEYVPVSPAL